jgi:hypothetical protein
MATSKLKNGKETRLDQIPATLIKEEEKGSKKPFMNSFKKCGRRRSYHMIVNMA